MENWICVTCGSQFAQSQTPPQECTICRDQRQYIGHQGQKWTTLATMKADGFRNTLKEQEKHLTEIATGPHFAIGERALLLQTEEGNVLWDCISYLDDETASAIERLGGLKAIAISHPHFYTSMVSWAERFDARIYLHENDHQWVMRPSERITFWSGETCALMSTITLVRLGGHFPGGTVLHWPGGADGRGALLTSDIIAVAADYNWVSFMYSYPNLIPLPTAEVSRISNTISMYTFDRIYGGWFGEVVTANAKEVVRKSADRYIRAQQQLLPVSKG